MKAIITRPLLTPFLLIGCLVTLPIAAPHARASEAEHAGLVEDMPPGLREAVSAATEREARNIYAAGERNGLATYEAINRTTDLRFMFDGAGVRIAPRADDASAWTARMTLAGFGYEGNIKAIHGLRRSPDVHVDGERLEYHYHTKRNGAASGDVAIIEWYVNDRRGLEHGFAVPTRPARPQGSLSHLAFELSVTGDLALVPVGSDSIGFVTANGDTVLRYGHLHVFDARGLELPARLTVAGASSIAIVVDDREAAYPLTVDPLFDTEVKLTASDAAAFDGFGFSVSISDDTTIVGALGDDDAGNRSGSAYIFQRDQGGVNIWGQVTKFTASDTVGGDEFGRSVSISDDTAIVGAFLDNDTGIDSGSAYIFQRDQGGANNWGEVKKLTGSDTVGFDLFGQSVSISGDTALVGAYHDDDAGSDSGSAFIFQRDQGGANIWGQVTKLSASDAAADDWFGYSVSISGDTAIVGARRDDDAGSDSGSAYIFHRDQGGANIWSQVTKLSASDAAANDWFGFSVSISGDTAIVGAHRDDDAGIESGSAYIFERGQGGANNWGEVRKLTASDATADDFFGWSVSISAHTAIVGAWSNEEVGVFGGSAYIFRRDEGGANIWGQVKKLTASDAAFDDEFGISVSISDNTAIVGAFVKDGAGINSGSAYIYFPSECGDGFCTGTESICSCLADCPDVCDDSVACTDDTCDGTNDCQFIPNDANCDNGLFCDGTETCDQVLDCQPGTNPCAGTASVCDETDDVCTACCMPDESCATISVSECAGAHGVAVDACLGDGNGNGGDDACEAFVPMGLDCYEIDCGLSEFSFGDDPIPADFFAPGSEPFDSVIFLGGTGQNGFDLSIERLGGMVFGDILPSEQTVDVELVSLSLASCAPIIAQTPGGPTEWNVRVGLSSVTPPTGTLTVTKTHANGGVFTMAFFVQSMLTFSRVDDPNVVLSFDSATDGGAPMRFVTIGEQAPWVHQATIPVAPCGVNFVPAVVEDVEGTQCCRRVGLSSPGQSLAVGAPEGLGCARGACCLPDETCDVVDPAESLVAEQVCENAPADGGLGGTYTEDGTNCDDSDGDGIPDVFETNTGDCATGDSCNSGTDPGNPDTDGDGCLDGEELSAGTDACDPCDLPVGGCGATPAVDCDDDGVPDECVLQDPNADCGAPSDVAPNFGPDGIPDTCQDANFLGACCRGAPFLNACFNATTTECNNFQGGVFQGYCTRCPTSLPIATHQGVSVEHFSSRPPECAIVSRSAGTEDCSLRSMFYDSWQTDLSGGGQMCHEFGLVGGTPVIPADFFGPGSLAFGGSICLEGEPLGFISIDVPGGPPIEGQFGNADTIVLRSDDPIGRCASTSPIGETVDVQVIALSLKSIGSFTVEFEGGNPSQEWTAEVSISGDPIVDPSVIPTLPLGSLTAIKTHCNGGTYNSVLKLLPKFKFTRVDDPNETRVLDFGTEPGFDPVQLTQDTDPQWVHETEGDVQLADDPCSEFRPGVEALAFQTVCDCNGNGQRDTCDIEFGVRSDCNTNAIPDDCDVAPADPDGNGLVSVDCNANGVPDECENDCNANGTADACDITAGTSQDINLNGTPDECEPDCNGNGVPDGWDLSTGASPDCQSNGLPDECDVAIGISPDCSGNGIPDGCEPDSDGDGIPDECEFETPVLSPPPHDILKNRYISIDPRGAGGLNVGQDLDIRVTMTGTLVNGVTAVGSVWWANAPNADCISIVGPTRPGTPPNWDACPTLHLSGCPIIPTASYDIVVLVGAAVSDPPLAAATQARPADSKWWGDAVGNFTGDAGNPPNIWSPPQGVTNFDDVNASLKTFINSAAVNATHTSITDIHPNKPTLPPPANQINKLVNIDDVFNFIKAFQGDEYPGPQIELCPDP